MHADVSGLRETTRNIDRYRRESGFHREIVALDPADGRPIVTVRTYAPGTVDCRSPVRRGREDLRGDRWPRR